MTTPHSVLCLAFALLAGVTGFFVAREVCRA